MIRAALVDVGGTLWPDVWPQAERIHAEQVTRLASGLRISVPEAERLRLALEHNDRLSRQRSDHVHDWRSLVGDAIRWRDLDGLTLDKVRSAMAVPAAGHVTFFDEVPGFLAGLAALGLRTIIVSNTSWRTAEDYERDFSDFDLSKLIDGTVTSADAGFRKPGEQIFLTALSLAGAGSRESVMIGDSVSNDILPAKQLGVRTVLIHARATAWQRRRSALWRAP